MKVSLIGIIEGIFFFLFIFFLSTLSKIENLD